MRSSRILVELLLTSYVLLFPFLIQFSDGKTSGRSGTGGEEYCSASDKPGGCRNNTKLALVQVIFRHGDRTPLLSWPKDPHNHKRSNSPIAQLFQRKGLLTKRGKSQGDELGKFLARRYKDFLQNIWLPEDIFVQSSDVDRTIMTAQTLLAGLFPPSQCSDKEPGGCEGKYSRDKRWQPIPVHTIAKKYDNKINFQGMRKLCPAYRAQMEQVLNCVEMQNYASLYDELFDDIKERTGLAEVNIKNVGLIYDTLFIQSSYELPLPNWTKPYYPLPLKELEEVGFQVLSSTRRMMRFNGGPLLKEVLGNMKSVANSRCSGRQKQADESTDAGGGDPRRQKKLYLYSGHDTTVAAFLATLGLLHKHVPAYVSAVIVELHEPIKTKVGGGGGDAEGTMDYIVKVFYRNETKGVPQELKISTCGDPCYLENLERVSEDIFVANWERACDGTDSWFGWLMTPFKKLVSVFHKWVNFCQMIQAGGNRL